MMLLLTGNKILSNQLKTTSKKLEANEMAQLLSNGLMYGGIHKQALVTNACLPIISVLLEKHVKIHATTC